MVFSSGSFLFLFLPALLAVYFLIPKRYRNLRNLALLCFSLVFYSFGGLRLLPIIFLSILINYLFGRLLEGERPKETKKKLVTAGVILNLLLLFCFKYLGFVTENLGAMIPGFPVYRLVLPIGISFYTFQGLSYVIDVYRNTVPAERSFLRVALYIALFPQLVAGPIVRYSTIAHEIRSRRETLEDVSQGMVRFLFGLSKKMLIANQMAVIADTAFEAGFFELTTGLAWIGLLAYTMQIYFDFSGYSDMAIGLGRIFGFHFLENFNYPYVAKSVTEFWRRWHISLSSWFRDYVYIPLGGNRVGRGKQIRNLLLVWGLTGFWHGAAWNFLLWGLYYALLLIGERYVWGKWLERLPASIRHIYTLFFVVFGWMLFRAADWSQVQVYTKALFGNALAVGGLDRVTYLLYQFRWELLIAVVASLPLRDKLRAALEDRREKAGAQVLLYWGPPILALLLGGISILQLLSSSFNPFIYFQF